MRYRQCLFLKFFIHQTNIGDMFYCITSNCNSKLWVMRLAKVSQFSLKMNLESMTVQRLFIYLKKFSKNVGRVHLITFQKQIGLKLHLSLPSILTKNPQKRDIIWRKAFFWRPIWSNCSPFRLYSAWNLSSNRLHFLQIWNL